MGLEALAWVAGGDSPAERAAALLGAAHGLWQSVGNPESVFPMLRHHDESVQLARSALGARRFDSAFRHGQAMGLDDAVSYALGEQPTDTAGPLGSLTRRELQVADLIAQGLTNKQIATKLAISQRTAQGHVEHILTKLGFTSRTQVAAWVVEDVGRQNSRSS